MAEQTAPAPPEETAHARAFYVCFHDGSGMGVAYPTAEAAVGAMHGIDDRSYFVMEGPVMAGTDRAVAERIVRPIEGFAPPYYLTHLRRDVALALATVRAEAREEGRAVYFTVYHEVEQIAGKALGYPWYRDDQKNFPGAAEVDGVCIGGHVTQTIVQELADKFAESRAEIERLKGGLKEAIEIGHGSLNRVDAAESALAKTRAALEPFAETADYHVFPRDDEVGIPIAGKHLRLARTAITSLSEVPPSELVSDAYKLPGPSPRDAALEDHDAE